MNVQEVCILVLVILLLIIGLGRSFEHILASPQDSGVKYIHKVTIYMCMHKYYCPARREWQ